MPQHELLACAQCGCFAFSCFEDFAIRVNTSAERLERWVLANTSGHETILTGNDTGEWIARWSKYSNASGSAGGHLSKGLCLLFLHPPAHGSEVSPAARNTLDSGRVTVSWWTHKIRGLHRNDFIMAAKTDAFFAAALTEGQ